MKADVVVKLSDESKVVAKELTVRKCAMLVEKAESEFQGLDDFIFVNTDMLVTYLGDSLTVTTKDGGTADMDYLYGSDWDAIGSAFVEANTPFLSRRRAKKALEEKRKQAEMATVADPEPSPYTGLAAS